MNGNEVWLTAKEIIDIIQISEATFRNKVSQKKGMWSNIQVNYEITPNGRIARYLASSLPTAYQEKLQGLLQLTRTAQQNTLNLASALSERCGKEVLTVVSSEVTRSAIEMGAEAILPMIEGLGFESHDYDELIQEYHCSTTTAVSVARKRAIVRWWRSEAKHLPTNQVEAFAYNTWEALKSLPEAGAIGRRYFSLKNTSLPMPKMIDNDSAGKMEEGVEEFLRSHYGTGNRPSKKRVWELYEAVRFERDWDSVSYQTICNWLAPIEVECALGREGDKQFKLEYGFTTLRGLPENFGDVWSLDGTPANIWVVNDKFQPRQCGYKGVCVDVATRYAVAVIAQTETLQMYKDTFISMVRATKRLPKSVQTDYFKGYKEFETWLQLLGVKMEKPSKGNARAKVVEGVLGHITNQIERYNPAFNGLNTTAREGRIGDEYRDTVAMPNALSWKEAKVYIEQITMQAWNNHVMTTLNHAPCGKMPVELFLEKSKNAPELSAERYVRITGHHHCVRLGVNGLQLNTSGYAYYYMPDFEEWGADRIATWLMQYRGKQFDVYLQDYEGKALVFEVETSKKVGWFVRKGEVEYSPDLHTKAGQEALGQSEAVRKAQLKAAKKNLKKAQLAYPDAQANMQNITQNAQDFVIHEGCLVNVHTGEVSPLASEEGVSVEDTLKGSVGKDSLNDAEEATKLGVEGVDWAWVEHPTKVGEYVRTYNKANF